jgi:hypothetical protein
MKAIVESMSNELAAGMSGRETSAREAGAGATGMANTHPTNGRMPGETAGMSAAALVVASQGCTACERKNDYRQHCIEKFHFEPPVRKYSMFASLKVRHLARRRYP